MELQRRELNFDGNKFWNIRGEFQNKVIWSKDKALHLIQDLKEDKN